jgi:hypothetical protein
MTEEIRHDYEVSSEGAVRHWPVPYARLEDTSPTATLPAQVTSVVAGTELTGTILVVDATRNEAIIDFTCGMVYYHEVRNVLTYNPGVAELTWGAINIGDTIYYDGSVSMPAGVYLSTSPLNTGGTANPIFGHAVQQNTADVFPKGGATASTQEVAVMQVGAGG